MNDKLKFKPCEKCEGKDDLCESCLHNAAAIDRLNIIISELKTVCDNANLLIELYTKTLEATSRASKNMAFKEAKKLLH